ncbi:cytochrome P450 [Kitasatospora acidiphila]|uniref:Cytochrome P450 n=1 Tax=Kitasatospora acidiphila TaxID=2567942 RepID=A0A540VYN6_9ACTN|nr:cytochrome P450 [Kitasatospora acidiphila]TQF01880.1 cytochrome P450 [Kitasatospora acidiphila]
MSIPGPEPRPDGGAGAIAAAGGLHTYQLWLHRSYGPVVRFQLPGADTAVSIADPVLLEATAHLDKRPGQLFAFLDPLFESGNPQVMPADEHGPWRRLLLWVLAGRPSHERQFAQLAALANELADRWAELPAAEPIALQHELTALSLRMICEYALGGDTVAPDGVVAAFEQVLADYLGRLYQVSTPGSPQDQAERTERALAYLRATVDQVIAAHRSGSRAERSDLVGALLEAGEHPARIRDTVLAVLLAAHHTTGVAVSWTLHLLGGHPEVADRVAAELDRVLGDRAVPDYADLRRLPYLEMVLKESMRLYPPGPYGARETTEPLALGPYRIPAGAVVFYPIWAVHLNPDVWPEPELFRPERFTPERVARRPRLAWLPFGLGPRACEGAALAMVEAQLLLAVLLRRFRFRPVPGQLVTPIERFVLWAAEDIHLTASPRGIR